MKEVSSEKISALRDIILDKADEKRQNLEAGARKEAEEWLLKEQEKLERETNLILQDAKKRADEIRRRQIMYAERDKATDSLRLQNRILSEALGRLQDKLVRLRDRDNYVDILTGMCMDALQALKGSSKLKLRLAAMDIPLAGTVIDRLKVLAPNVEIVFDQEPAPILGGCWLMTEDGHRQVNSDWQNITQEMADKLAERLLPLL